MLSSAAEALPAGDGWLFEPKWDGFRTLVFRDGDEILLQSRDEKPLNRYFPELLAPLADAFPERCVVDGEIVIDDAALGEHVGERRQELRSEEHTSELQSLAYLVCRLLLEKKKKTKQTTH